VRGTLRTSLTGLTVVIAFAFCAPRLAIADDQAPPPADDQKKADEAQPAADGGQPAADGGQPAAADPLAGQEPQGPPAPPLAPSEGAARVEGPAQPPAPPAPPRPPAPGAPYATLSSQPAQLPAAQSNVPPRPPQPPRPPRPPAPGDAKPQVQPASRTTLQTPPGQSSEAGKPAVEEPKTPGAEARPEAKESDEKKPEPKKPAKGKVHVNRFHFTGNAVIPTADLDTAVKGEADKDHDLESLKQVAETVTKLYQERGFTVARAFVPTQDVKGGIVEISCVEGKVGQILVEGNSSYTSEFIQQQISAAATEGVLVNSGLEHQLLLLNDLPHLKVAATLEQGKEPGTVDIRCKAEEHFPVSFTLDVNNFGNDGTGKTRIGGQVDWSNAVLCGDLVSIRGVIGSEGDNYDYTRVGYVAPINRCGTKVGAYGYWGTFGVDQQFSALDISGDSWGGGFYATHPILKGRCMSLVAEAGFDIKDTELSMLGELSSDDEIREIHLGASLDQSIWQGRNFVSLYWYEGLGEFLGGLSEDDRRASRREADNSFARWNFSATRLQFVTEFLSAMVRFNSQLAVDSLVAGEQMQIGGADSVRGYQAAEFSGDEGYSVSFEPRVTFCRDMWYVPQLAAFVDHGGVYRKAPLVSQSEWEFLTGVGFGLRWSAPHDVDVRFDIGWPIGQDSQTGDDPTFYVAGSVKF